MTVYDETVSHKNKTYEDVSVDDLGKKDEGPRQPNLEVRFLNLF